ncbi:glutamine synthetase [Chytriomyces confervae]|uniref:Glutamine synthetase n=1 Tax=Chytriomyces confervae TaxID=246404 RepID=A0A507D252_9FUNG|nr:glutamine synthetase [Chytriomyces confervae]
MREEGSSARRVLGDAFVEHYVGTRLHEWRLWETAVTNWEVSRYFEVI